MLSHIPCQFVPGFYFWECLTVSLQAAKGFLLFIHSFAGSMEFVTISLLLASFNPVYSFLLALMVNARHLFYRISMLDTYKDYKGIKKFYLIYGMCGQLPTT